MLQPGLFIRSGVFTSGKTSTSVANSKNFNPYEQINIFNQPTGYSHIEIGPASDLVELVWDIYYYSLYYNSYKEKMELLELYQVTIYNLENYSTKDLFSNAYNLVKTRKFFPDLWTRVKLFFGKAPKCVLNSYQAQKQIDEIINVYLPNRQKFVDRFGDDLILNYFFNLSLDELQIYFGVRAFKINFTGDNEFLVDFISFPVKLNTRIEGIVQSEQMLDVYFRRQASSYLRNSVRFLGLIKKEESFMPKDTEKVRLDDSSIISTSTSINFYKLFGVPKLQYYRNHLISAKSKKLYRPGLLFEHIRKMTDNYNETFKKQKKQ